MAYMKLSIHIICGLELWSNVLASHVEWPELQPLLHPMVQLIFGVIHIKSTSIHLPLRIQLLCLLNKLAKVNRTFIPVFTALLECFHSIRSYLTYAASGTTERLDNIINNTISEEELIYLII